MIVRAEQVAAFEFDGLWIADYTAGHAELSASLASVEVPPGARHRRSWSTRSDKYYYVASGRLRFEAEELAAGDVVVVPKGEAFSYENTSGETAVLLLLHTPPFALETERFER